MIQLPAGLHVQRQLQRAVQRDLFNCSKSLVRSIEGLSREVRANANPMHRDFPCLQHFMVALSHAKATQLLWRRGSEDTCDSEPGAARVKVPSSKRKESAR